jgi:hypothetical protein
MRAAQQPIDVIAEAKKLDLPHGHYLVFGSGILTALGIRVLSGGCVRRSPRERCARAPDCPFEAGCRHARLP